MPRTFLVKSSKKRNGFSGLPIIGSSEMAGAVRNMRFDVSGAQRSCVKCEMDRGIDVKTDKNFKKEKTKTGIFMPIDAKRAKLVPCRWKEVDQAIKEPAKGNNHCSTLCDQSPINISGGAEDINDFEERPVKKPAAESQKFLDKLRKYMTVEDIDNGVASSCHKVSKIKSRFIKGNNSAIRRPVALIPERCTCLNCQKGYRQQLLVDRECQIMEEPKHNFSCNVNDKRFDDFDISCKEQFTDKSLVLQVTAERFCRNQMSNNAIGVTETVSRDRAARYLLERKIVRHDSEHLLRVNEGCRREDREDADMGTWGKSLGRSDCVQTGRILHIQEGWQAEESSPMSKPDNLNCKKKGGNHSDVIKKEDKWYRNISNFQMMKNFRVYGERLHDQDDEQGSKESSITCMTMARRCECHECRECLANRTKEMNVESRILGPRRKSISDKKATKNEENIKCDVKRENKDMLDSWGEEMRKSANDWKMVDKSASCLERQLGDTGEVHLRCKYDKCKTKEEPDNPWQILGKKCCCGDDCEATKKQQVQTFDGNTTKAEVKREKCASVSRGTIFCVEDPFDLEDSSTNDQVFQNADVDASHLEIYRREDSNIRDKEKRPIVRQMKEKDPGKKSRALANWLERKRVAELNDAFERLRKIVPSYGNEDRSLSKIKTLRYASTYINHLAIISDKQCRYGIDDLKNGLIQFVDMDPMLQRCQEHLESQRII